MIPSPHLNVEVSNDQWKALNPTVCNVRIGAVIPQIFGDKAKTKIAKRRIDLWLATSIATHEFWMDWHSWTASQLTPTFLSHYVIIIMRCKRRKQLSRRRYEESTERQGVGRTAFIEAAYLHSTCEWRTCPLLVTQPWSNEGYIEACLHYPWIQYAKATGNWTSHASNYS